MPGLVEAGKHALNISRLMGVQYTILDVIFQMNSFEKSIRRIMFKVRFKQTDF